MELIIQLKIMQKKLKKVINVNVKFKFNKKYPDGMKRKLLEISKLNL